jgi:hypothetical protein
MILIGYDDHSKAYRCLDYTRRRITIPRDIPFDENLIGILYQHDISSSGNDIF